jgi:hypothetical protein
VGCVKYVTRPISSWPAGVTVARRNSPFKASYGVSEDLLMRELWHLGARDVVLEIDIQASDLRLDGTLRANARPQGPRVILYAATKHGPLMMPCATFAHWQDNIRAIALSLEALRKVDRYGCSQRGEQYRGWTAIPASTGVTTRVHAAWDILAREAAGEPGSAIKPEHRSRETLDRYFREAAMMAHPDAGGTDERMAAVNRARETILADLVP